MWKQIFALKQHESGPIARPSNRLHRPSEPAGSYRTLYPDWLPSASRQRRNRTTKVRVRFRHVTEV